MKTTKYPIYGAIYGASGTYKSGALAELARYNWITHRLKTRVFNCDTGGIAAYRSLIAAGAVDMIDLFSPLDGVIDTEKWFNTNPQSFALEVAKGNWFKVEKGRVMIVQKAHLDPAYGTLIVEGLNAMADRIANYFITNNMKVGQDLAITYQVAGVADGTPSQNLGKLALSHYGAIQDFFVHRIFPALWGLNYNEVLCTTHEGLGKDDLEGVSYGPLIIGKALTSHLPEMVPFLLHADSQQKKDPTSPGDFKVEHRAYFVKHQDLGAPTNPKAQWPANSRIYGDSYHELLKVYKGGFVPLTEKPGLPGFIAKYRALEEASEKALELPPLVPAASAPVISQPTTPVVSTTPPTNLK